MKTRRCLYIVLNVLLLSCWISACSSQTSVIEQTDICAPPCWHGIYVGQTTKADALTQLTNATDIDVSTLHEEEMVEERWSAVSWRFSPEVASTLGVISFYDDVAMEIEFRTYEGLTVGEAVKTLGNPELVAANFQCVPNDAMIVHLINRTKGIMITSITRYFRITATLSGPEEFEISENDAVMGVYYIEPSKIEQLVEKEFFSLIEMITYGDLQLDMDSLPPWSGFGEPISYIDLCGR